MNYNKTLKSRLKYEIKQDLSEISPKNKKNLNFGLLRFFKVCLKNLGFFIEAIFQP